MNGLAGAPAWSSSTMVACWILRNRNLSSGALEAERASILPNPPGKRDFPELAGRFLTFPHWPIPYTGVPIVVTSGQQQVLIPGVGGTSLASPIFTAFWAIANQKAGHSLGQAAPTIAGLKTGLTDVLPLTSPTNVTGTVYDSGGATLYSANDLFAGAVQRHDLHQCGVGCGPGCGPGESASVLIAP